MTSKNEDGALLDLRGIEKKEWEKPQITQLNIKKTKSGTYNASTEGSFWFITWGPHSN